MVDLLDLIEGKRFLGREFLTWLWFESELFEGTIEIPGEGSFGLWLEGQITLDGAGQSQEQSKLRGAAPSMGPEAREALRQGKLPTSARVRLERGEQAYGFVLHAETLRLASVKIPAVLTEEGDEDEPFYERMRLLEQLEALLGAVYGEFVALRLSPAWDAHVLPAMRAWMNEQTVDADAYRKGRHVEKRPKKARAPVAV
jgi:hypothetical protein